MIDPELYFSLISLKRVFLASVPVYVATITLIKHIGCSRNIEEGKSMNYRNNSFLFKIEIVSINYHFSVYTAHGSSKIRSRCPSREVHAKSRLPFTAR